MISEERPRDAATRTAAVRELRQTFGQRGNLVVELVGIADRERVLVQRAQLAQVLGVDVAHLHVEGRQRGHGWRDDEL